ncbi:MAG TPA: mandelate racemase/muconate lactonizing enzyme family protein [Dehalococcoidia bacterium]|nr:mandelate racemase/muconate lactonizing enzyme family protein [Dehalococcoidia bacterium]MDP6273719.1 mandelate racemase/muconate lactonizing enzyme family protein [Dehalococcoidia bacterium]MDP7161711.1 mandelate racemase/muconate lactonizing enzyme family protein [Dehalococcoidia bacterium]MDP7212556.1 mandelate racemase/muconate lactonizing enzyme family protein [Dehalococcoidia bacterium]MDP7514321.1 mandelate racemase/muconate lactonizing enzyme family protein [Dehalococcoidia bacterium
MKITKIETIILKDIWPVTWVQIHTDDSIVGLGEVWVNGTGSVATYVAEVLAPELLGKDPRDIERHWARMYYVGRSTGNRGVNMLAMSAVDIALWDIYAQSAGVPLYQVLGGKFRERIRVYNTCFDPIMPHSGSNDDSGLYDLKAQWEDPGALAESLLADGVTAMKIWPFDRYADKSNGQFIGTEDLEAATRPFREIREAVGNRIDIALELHNRWNLPASKQIARSVEPYNAMWIEDAMPLNNIDSLKELKDSTTVPVCASETISTRWGFRDVFEKHATDIVMIDVTWVGGLSEARKIGYAAETYGLPFAPHDASGPVTLMASTHLDMHLPNAVVQETVRAFMRTWYADVVDVLPVIEDGHISAPDTPGLGMKLLPGVMDRPDADVTATTL